MSLDTKHNVSKCIYSFQKYVAKSHLAKQVRLAETLGEPPFGNFYRPSVLTFSNLKVL